MVTRASTKEVSTAYSEVRQRREDFHDASSHLKQAVTPPRREGEPAILTISFYKYRRDAVKKILDDLGIDLPNSDDETPGNISTEKLKCQSTESAKLALDSLRDLLYRKGSFGSSFSSTPQ